MDKEEFIKQLENEREWARIKDSKLSTYLSDDYYIGKTYAYKRAIQLAERLDEPTHEPMKVPEELYVLIHNAEWFAKLDSDMARITTLYEKYISNGFLSETEDWLDKHVDDVLDAVRYGCKPMKKRWTIIQHISHAKLYLRSYSATSSFEDDLGEFDGDKSRCLVFTDKAKAEAVATLVGGKVEEVTS